ncbi:recombination-associated protein RdgC [Salinisphaera aquimarina]|uniref:Recombination-associated protein RdgC n=1 Tax=Salinisphaera aquimarina TaxID=2094031 RepID=A0ABV7ESU2_9GAMM
MWIRNLCVFLGSERFGWTAAELEERLAAALCPPCGDQHPSTQGFVPPIKGEHAMVYVVDDLAVCLHQEVSRVLPSAVLNEEVEERVERIETGEGRKVSRRERADIKDQAHFELLPRAFTRSRRTHLIMDLRDNRVWVDCSAEKRAEDIVASLRTALGSLPVTRPSPAVSPAEEMTSWLQEPAKLPNGFECGDRCALEANDDTKSSVRVSAMDLQRDEVLAHVASGMHVVRLNLSVDDAIEFDLDENLDLKRLRALDLIQEDIDNLDTEDAVAELHARLSLQGQVIRGLLDRVYTHFGVAGTANAQAA